MKDLDTLRFKPIEILLAEDNPGDARLTIEGFKDAKVKNHITVVEDGKEALAYLRHEGPYANVALPDLILLDLTMTKQDGRAATAPRLSHKVTTGHNAVCMRDSSTYMMRGLWTGWTLSIKQI